MATAFDHNVVTPGTVEAGEAVILDSNKDASGIRNLGVTNLDAGASGTAGSLDVFPTTASKGKLAITCTDQTGDTTVTLNAGAMAAARTITIPDPGAAADLVVTAGNQTIGGVKTFSSQPLTSAGVGAIVAATGLTISERGTGIVHQTVFTFTNVDFALVDEAGVVAYTGKQLYDFPEGLIFIMGAVADLGLTKSSAGVNTDWDGDIGVGTATAGNDGTLSGTEQDIIPTTATPQAVAGVTTADAISTDTETKVHDGTGTAKDLFLNLLVDDADHDVTGTPCNLIVNGTLTVTWINLGDK